MARVAPAWLQLEVHREINPPKAKSSDRNKQPEYTLLPGETAAVDLTVEISGAELVYGFNEGLITLDDVLVLRIVNGRDHFIPLHGQWLPTCFHRTLDDLVRIPKGVRALPKPGAQAA